MASLRFSRPTQIESEWSSSTWAPNQSTGPTSRSSTHSPAIATLSPGQRAMINDGAVRHVILYHVGCVSDT